MSEVRVEEEDTDELALYKMMREAFGASFGLLSHRVFCVEILLP